MLNSETNQASLINSIQQHGLVEIPNGMMGLSWRIVRGGDYLKFWESWVIQGFRFCGHPHVPVWLQPQNADKNWSPGYCTDGNYRHQTPVEVYLILVSTSCFEIHDERSSWDIGSARASTRGNRTQPSTIVMICNVYNCICIYILFVFTLYIQNHYSIAPSFFF